MNRLFHLGLAASIALALSASGAFAQNVPAPTTTVPAPTNKGAFILNEYDVHDPVAFKALTAELRQSLKAFKGEFVLREKVESLFGGTPSNLTVLSFPTIADAKAWLASPAFAKIKADRVKAADVRGYLVEKLD